MFIFPQKRKSTDCSNSNYSCNSNENSVSATQIDSALSRKPINAISESLSSFTSSPSSATNTLKKQLPQQAQNSKRTIGGTSSLIPSNAAAATYPATDIISPGDQHSALMNEFKRAHQRMFKNGFLESDCQQVWTFFHSHLRAIYLNEC